MKTKRELKASSGRGISIGQLLRLVGLILVGLTGAQVATCENSFSAEPIEGVVVDEKSGAPIEGVVVVAWWQLTKWGMTHPRDAGTLMALEATTDSTGRYRIPGWGPRHWDEGTVSDKAPEMFFFKAGYDPGGRNNTIYTDGNMPKSGLPPPGRQGVRSAWDGETVTLRLATADLEGYARRLRILLLKIDNFYGAGCDWRANLPGMNSELVKAASYFDEKRFNPFFAESAHEYFSYKSRSKPCQHTTLPK